MEDAATAEISRAQLWQWLRYRVHLEDGREISREFVAQTLTDILQRMKQSLTPTALANSKFERAAQLLTQMCFGDFQEFLTTVMYAEIP